jgi:hypothetical protein
MWNSSAFCYWVKLKSCSVLVPAANQTGSFFPGHTHEKALNEGLATYQVMHLSNIPHQLKILNPTWFHTGNGPDKGGNYSYGSTFEGIQAAVQMQRQRGNGYCEKNKQMPFILGTTIDESEIDYLVEAYYPLPLFLTSGLMKLPVKSEG